MIDLPFVKKVNVSYEKPPKRHIFASEPPAQIILNGKFGVIVVVMQKGSIYILKQNDNPLTLYKGNNPVIYEVDLGSRTIPIELSREGLPSNTNGYSFMGKIEVDVRVDQNRIQDYLTGHREPLKVLVSTIYNDARRMSRNYSIKDVGQAEKAIENYLINRNYRQSGLSIGIIRVQLTQDSAFSRHVEMMRAQEEKQSLERVEVTNRTATGKEMLKDIQALLISKYLDDPKELKKYIDEQRNNRTQILRIVAQLVQDGIIPADNINKILGNVYAADLLELSDGNSVEGGGNLLTSGASYQEDDEEIGNRFVGLAGSPTDFGGDADFTDDNIDLDDIDVAGDDDDIL